MIFSLQDHLSIMNEHNGQTKVAEARTMIMRFSNEFTGAAYKKCEPKLVLPLLLEEVPPDKLPLD